jgi:hypothetical protein
MPLAVAVKAAMKWFSFAKRHEMGTPSQSWGTTSAPAHFCVAVAGNSF